MKQLEELVQKFDDLGNKIDTSVMFSNVIYLHIDREIEASITKRDASRLLTLRLFREHMTRRLHLGTDDFVKTELKPFLYFIEDIPNEPSIIGIPETKQTTKAKKTAKTAKTKKTKNPEEIPSEEKKKSPKEDDIKYKALKHILKQLPFSIYDECVSQQRSKGFYMKKEHLVKKIIDTAELKDLFPKGTNIGKLTKEGICKEIFKN